MLRIHFTAEDLTKVRVGASFGPLAETVFALDALQRRTSPVLFGAWRRSVVPHIDHRVRRLGELLPRAWVFDLISITGPARTLDQGIEALERAPARMVRTELEHTASAHCRPPPWAGGLAERDPRIRREVAGTVRGLHDVAVAPFWERTRVLLQAEQARLVRILGEQGVDRLLSTLHASMRWRPPVLYIRSAVAPTSADRWLGGRGLVVVPSLFCPAGYPTSYVADDHDGPNMLFFPAVRDPAATSELWSPGAHHHGALGALVGRTRAAVLACLGDNPCTTSELATRLACSPATASEHATVLRRAGLVHTQRHGSAVLHTLTPLGESLLARNH